MISQRLRYLMRLERLHELYQSFASRFVIDVSHLFKSSSTRDGEMSKGWLNRTKHHANVSLKKELEYVLTKVQGVWSIAQNAGSRSLYFFVLYKVHALESAGDPSTLVVSV